MKRISKMSAVVAVLLVTSCVKDLDRVPFVSVTSATVYNDAANYKQILAKLYAGLAVSGQQRACGQARHQRH
ncbi:MAG: hypothetical protein R2822_30815 [Spirosomataceae bacterium]